MKRLIERGLPTTLFGIDKPMLELKADAPLRITNGNGHEEQGGDGGGAMGGA